MILSYTNSETVKQYLPGIYFIGVAAWIGLQNSNLWMGLFITLFIIQMILNNRYINLLLGCLMISWSLYMAFTMFIEVERTFKYVSLAVCFTVLNLYMSRMLFLNQNFTLAPLRENSLDETLFL